MKKVLTALFSIGYCAMIPVSAAYVVWNVLRNSDENASCVAQYPF